MSSIGTSPFQMILKYLPGDEFRQVLAVVCGVGVGVGTVLLQSRIHTFKAVDTIGAYSK